MLQQVSLKAKLVAAFIIAGFKKVLKLRSKKNYIKGVVYSFGKDRFKYMGKTAEGYSLWRPVKTV